MSTIPRSFSHIGLSVPDLDKAVDFYRDVLGFYVIMPPMKIVADESDIGVMCNDVFGEGWGEFRTAINSNTTWEVMVIILLLNGLPTRCSSPHWAPWPSRTSKNLRCLTPTACSIRFRR